MSKKVMAVSRPDMGRWCHLVRAIGPAFVGYFFNISALLLIFSSLLMAQDFIAPQAITTTGDHSNVDLAVELDGTLYLAYAENDDTVRLVRSDDAGRTWVSQHNAYSLTGPIRLALHPTYLDETALVYLEGRTSRRYANFYTTKNDYDWIWWDNTLVTWPALTDNEAVGHYPYLAYFAVFSVMPDDVRRDIKLYRTDSNAFEWYEISNPFSTEEYQEYMASIAHELDRLHMVCLRWNTIDNLAEVYYVRTKNFGDYSTWDEPQRLSSMSHDCDNPWIVGNLYWLIVLWEVEVSSSDRDIYFVYTNDNGRTWSNPQVFVATSAKEELIDVYADNGGYIHVLYQADGVPYYSRALLGKWVFSTPQAIPSPVGTSWITQTYSRLRGAVAGDTDGKPYIVLRAADRQLYFVTTGTEETNPALCKSTNLLDFGTTTTSKSFEIWNCGTGTLAYTIYPDKPWIQVSPTSGSSTGEHDVVTVVVDRSGLVPGHYSGVITISPSYGANQTVEVLVDVSTGGGVCGGPLASTPWPMFQGGNKHQGLSPYVGPSRPRKKWEYPTDWSADQFYASPVFGTDGYLYIQDFNGVIYRINPQDGSGVRFYAIGHKSAGSMAVAADGTLYVPVWDEGLVYAINQDGSLRWVSPLLEPDVWHGSPAIGSDGTVYIGSGFTFYALNCENGAVKWSVRVGDNLQSSSPAIAYVNGEERIYFGSEAGNVYCYTSTGQLVWAFPTSGGVTNPVAIGEDGTIYAQSWYYMYAINPNGTQKWRNSCGLSTDRGVSPAIGPDGTIYLITGRDLCAIDPSTGAVKWTYHHTASLYTSPTVDANGVIYISDNYYTYAINPSDGSLKWRIEGGGEYSAPILGPGGIIYVGSSYMDRVYAFEESGVPPDTTPPALVRDFRASDGEDGRSTLTWTNPPDDDLAEVVVRRKTSGYPANHTDGDVVYQNTSPVPGQAISYTNTGLTNGTIYYYAVFSRDTHGNWNDTVEQGKNADTGLPSPEQQGTVIVTVKDKRLHYGIPDAALVLEPNPLGFTPRTDATGECCFSIPAGVYTLTIIANGYLQESETLHVFAGEKTVSLLLLTHQGDILWQELDAALDKLGRRARDLVLNEASEIDDMFAILGRLDAAEDFRGVLALCLNLSLFIWRTGTDVANIRAASDLDDLLPKIEGEIRSFWREEVERRIVPIGGRAGKLVLDVVDMGLGSAQSIYAPYFADIVTSYKKVGGLGKYESWVSALERLYNKILALSNVDIDGRVFSYLVDDPDCSPLDASVDAILLSLQEELDDIADNEFPDQRIPPGLFESMGVVINIINELSKNLARAARDQAQIVTPRWNAGGFLDFIELGTSFELAKQFSELAENLDRLERARTGLAVSESLASVALGGLGFMGKCALGVATGGLGFLVDLGVVLGSSLAVKTAYDYIEGGLGVTEEAETAIFSLLVGLVDAAVLQMWQDIEALAQFNTIVRVLRMIRDSGFDPGVTADRDISASLSCTLSKRVGEAGLLGEHEVSVNVRLSNRSSKPYTGRVVAYVYDAAADSGVRPRAIFVATESVELPGGGTWSGSLKTDVLLPVVAMREEAISFLRVEAILLTGLRRISLGTELVPYIPEVVISIKEKSILDTHVSTGEYITAPYTPDPGTYEVVLQANWSGSDIDLHLYDERGRHIGVNYDTGEVELEIPGGWYSGRNQCPETIRVFNIQPGNYTVELVGVDADEERCTVSAVELPFLGAKLAAIPDLIHGTVLAGTTWSDVIQIHELYGQADIENVQADLVRLGCAGSGVTVTIQPSGNTIPAGGMLLIRLTAEAGLSIQTGKCSGVVRVQGQANGEVVSIEIPLTLSLISVSRAKQMITHGPNPVPSQGCIFWLNLPGDAVAATLKIFDVDGAVLVSIPLDPTADRYPQAGRWIPRDAQGRLLGTGLYLYLVEIVHSDGRVTRSPVQKMVIQR